MKRPARRSRGFTLLEVMMATAVLAVGTVSVLTVFGSGIAFAYRRTAQQQLTQVLAEARSDARSMVNAWRPGAAAKPAAGGAAGAKPAGAAAAPATTPAGEGNETEPRNSKTFSAYSYVVRFEPVQRGVPEAGWTTTVKLSWGDRQSYEETLVITPDVIPDEEFAFSSTFEEEKAASQAGGARETR